MSYVMQYCSCPAVLVLRSEGVTETINVMAGSHGSRFLGIFNTPWILAVRFNAAC